MGGAGGPVAALWEDSGRPKITASETPTSASAAARRVRTPAAAGTLPRLDQRLRVDMLDGIAPS